MIPFLPHTLDADGTANILADGTAATSWIGAQGYTDEQPIGTTDAVDAADAFSAGVRYTSGGAVRLHDATAGLPAGAVQVGGGFAVSSDGQLCFTSDAVASDSTLIGGVAVTPDGRVHATVTV